MSAQSIDAGLGQASRGLSWLFLVGFLVLVGAARGVYSAQELPPSARFESLVFLGSVTFLWNWIRLQCEPHGVRFPMDLAWFMVLLWFLLSPSVAGREVAWAREVRHAHRSVCTELRRDRSRTQRPGLARLSDEAAQQGDEADER